MTRPALLLLALALAACSGHAPSGAPATPQDAVARQDGFTVRASTQLTSALSPAMAREYGLARSDTQVMLLVMTRRDVDGQEQAAPAQVRARVTDLRGQSRELVLRELHTRSGNDTLVDYVATVEVNPPETLSFELQVTPQAGGGASPVPEPSNAIAMRFTRDFLPR